MKILHRFQGGSDGADPVAGVVADKAGNLYGTTLSGGGSQVCSGQSYQGCGTVFELVRDGNTFAETILYAFQDGSTGTGPMASLVFDPAGNLYGTTASGGTNGFGVVYQLTPPAQKGGTWTETVLYSFTNRTNGVSPSRLTIDPAGDLYGENPGFDDHGYVYELTPPALKGGTWNYSLLYTFKGGLIYHDGTQPVGGLRLDKAGNLYGTTQFGGVGLGCDYKDGCGIVFELKHPTKQGGAWTEKVLYRFSDSPDGAEPRGGVTFGRKDRSLYGTTLRGGSNGLGATFKLSPPTQKGGSRTETLIYSFASASWVGPNAPVVFDKAGNLYSTSIAGQAKLSGGIFELSPPLQQGDPWTETVLHQGMGGATTPSGVMLNAAENALYGTLSGNGPRNHGVVFKIALP